VADALPVPEGARLVREDADDCSGGLKHETDACSLQLDFETTQPQIDVMEFYLRHLGSEGWSVTTEVSERNVYLAKEESSIQLSLRVPPGFCPDSALFPEEAAMCVAEEIRRDDGKARAYIIAITPR
jgi:hypothetical protein